MSKKSPYDTEKMLHDLFNLAEPKYDVEEINFDDEIELSNPYDELDEIENLPYFLRRQAD